MIWVCGTLKAIHSVKCSIYRFLYIHPSNRNGLFFNWKNGTKLLNVYRAMLSQSFCNNTEKLINLLSEEVFIASLFVWMYECETRFSKNLFFFIKFIHISITSATICYINLIEVSALLAWLLALYHCYCVLYVT